MKLAKLIFVLCASLVIGMPMQAQKLWSLKSTGNGWQWVPPSGPPVCKYAGVSMVNESQIKRNGQFRALWPDKYPNKATWAAKQAERLKSWGFNAFGWASDIRLSSYLPVVAPFMGSTWLMRDDKPYHIKSLYWNYGGEVCGDKFYRGYQYGGQVDAFDPGAAAAWMDAVTKLVHGCGGPGGLCWDSNTMWIATEEPDMLTGLGHVNDHEDMAVIILDANPVQSASKGGTTYADKMVYAKTAMRDFLADRYGCHGSADPAASNYCGRGPAASALAALNTAWFGSSIYTTWNTSDSGDLTGIHNGTYHSYGTGTGFLDENGTHSLNASTKRSCHVFPLQNWPFSTQIKTDTQAFVAYFAQVYSQKIVAAFNQSSISPHPPLLAPLYDGPSYVYTAMAPYYDGFWISPAGEPNEDTQAARVAMVKRVIAASSVPGGKSMPIVYADYFVSQRDSYYPKAPGNGVFATQYLRGAAQAGDWQAILPFRDVNGKYVVVGFEHWALYDQVNAFMDGGMATAFADNPLDGSAAAITVTHSDVWQANHSYSYPSLIWDGANYQARTSSATGTDTPTPCTSGSTSPNWATKMGARTTDNTCYWRNEGPYALRVESGIPSTATIPNVAFGDAITPIANLLNAGFCDPPQ